MEVRQGDVKKLVSWLLQLDYLPWETISPIMRVGVVIKVVLIAKMKGCDLETPRSRHP